VPRRTELSIGEIHMACRPQTLSRAVEIALSGDASCIDEFEDRLLAEGYWDFDSHTIPMGLRVELTKLCWRAPLVR
jgi:hypothetical protein